MAERLHPQTSENANGTEKLFKTGGFIRFIREIYPLCRKTQVPEFIGHLARDLQPIVQENPLGLSITESQKSFLTVRGSSIKRANLGDPPGYWKVSEVYRDIPSWERETLTPLANEVVKKASVGPNDIDIVFRPKEGKTMQDVYQSLIKSLILQKFCLAEQDNRITTLVKTGHKIKEPYDDYEVTLNHLEINGQDSPPVQAISLSFSYYGKPILKVDLVKAPKDEEVYNNFRLSGAASPFDLNTMGFLHLTKDNRLLLTYDTLIKHYLDNPNLIRLYYQSSSFTFINSYYARLRTMLQRTLWFNNFKNQPQPWFGDYSLPTILQQINRAWLDQIPLEEDVWLNYLDKPEQLNKLKNRLPDVVTDFIVGLTYDPFLFLKLAYETKLLSYLPIGQYVKEPADLLKIIGYMAEEFTSIKYDEFTYRSYQHLFLQDPTNSLPLLSKEYQMDEFYKAHPRLIHSGPFILLRALNKMIAKEKGSPLPESFNSIVWLFNPLVFYRQHHQKEESPTPSPAATASVRSAFSDEIRD